MSSVHPGVSFLLASLMLLSCLGGVSYGRVTWVTISRLSSFDGGDWGYGPRVMVGSPMAIINGTGSDDDLVSECPPLVLSLISAFSGEPAYFHLPGTL